MHSYTTGKNETQPNQNVINEYNKNSKKLQIHLNTALGIKLV
jgi:hypothetical protein